MRKAPLLELGSTVDNCIENMKYILNTNLKAEIHKASEIFHLKLESGVNEILKIRHKKLK